VHPPSPKRLPPRLSPSFQHAPPPTRKGKGKARAPPCPPPNSNEDPKYLIPYYETKLSRAFGDPERYTQLFPHFYEAGEFWRGAYDLASFTPGYLHPDYTSSPRYAQAASGSGSGGRTKKASKPPSTQQVASAAASPLKKGPPSRPRAQRCFFAPRLSPAPHPDAPAIAATFHDIAARVLREADCFLLLGFSASVNVRGPFLSQSLTRRHQPRPTPPTLNPSPGP